MQTDRRLYLALRDLYNMLTPDTALEKARMNEAHTALLQFELELGPLPEWATQHNLTKEPVLWAQLFTLCGRERGNGLIYHVGNSGESFGVITDMGNTMTLNREELAQCYEIGDFIMDEAAYLKRARQNEEWEREMRQPEPGSDFATHE